MNIIQPQKSKWYRNVCPHCRQETSSRPLDWTNSDGHEFTTAPHEDPFNCIAYLSSIINNLVDDVSSLKEQAYEGD